MDAPKIFNSIRFSVNRNTFKPACKDCGSTNLTVRVHPKLDTAHRANVYTKCLCGVEENYVINRELKRL